MTKSATKMCQTCGVTKSRSAFDLTSRGHASRTCKSCAEKQVHRETVLRTPIVGCVRCLQYKLRAEFPTRPGQKRISPVCIACREIEKKERAKRRRARKTTKVIKGVLSRHCRQCNKWKPLDEDHFHLSFRKKDQKRVFDYWCRSCQTQRSAQNYQAIQADPERKKRHRELTRDRQRRWRERNPDAARQAAARYKDKVRADPERWEKFLQDQRICYRLRKERRGLGYKENRQLQKARGAYKTTGAGRVDAEPLRVWLEAVIAQEVPGRLEYGWRRSSDSDGHGIEDLAVRLGIHSRVMRRIRYVEYESVSFRVARNLLDRYERSVMIDGIRLERELIDWATELPGNGTRLLRYMDRAERVAHLAGAIVTEPGDLWPERRDES